MRNNITQMIRSDATTADAVHDEIMQAIEADVGVPIKLIVPVDTNDEDKSISLGLIFEDDRKMLITLTLSLTRSGNACMRTQGRWCE